MAGVWPAHFRDGGEVFEVVFWLDLSAKIIIGIPLKQKIMGNIPGILNITGHIGHQEHAHIPAQVSVI